MTPFTRSFNRYAIAGAATLLLASCASFSDINTDARIRAPANYTTDASLPAQGGQWPALSWTREIGGAPLQALVDEALAGNPGMQAAAARVAAAQAVAEAAGAAARPTMAANFGSTYQRYSENGMVPPALGGAVRSDNQLSLNLSYDIDFWGKHAAELRAALSQGQAAEAEQYASRLVLTASIAHAWIQLARQHAQLDLVGQQLAVRQKIDHLTGLRERAGLGNRSDSELARQQHAALRAEQAQGLEAIALTRNQLAALMGQGPDRGKSIAAPGLPPDAALSLPDEVPLGLLGRRADIVAARWRVEAAQGDIDATRADFYPNVNLRAFAGLSSLGLSNLLSGGSVIAGIGPAIRLPVFETGALRAQLKGRVAAYEGAVATYNQALTDALREVADQMQSMRAAADQHGHQRIAAEAAANGLTLARQRERAGASNMLPVLSSELAWLSQRRLELDQHARQAALRVSLIKALGGGFDAGAELHPVLHPAPSHPPIPAKSAS